MMFFFSSKIASPWRYGRSATYRESYTEEFTTEGNLAISRCTRQNRRVCIHTHTHTPRSFAIKTLDARPWTSSLNNQVLVPPNWHSASSANGHNKLSVMQRNWETLRPRVPIYFCFTLSLSLPLSFFFCCCCYRSLSSAAYTTHFEMPSHRKKTARFFFVPSLRCSIVSRSK